MKKYTRTILALILAVVSALALPINAGATAYSGSIGTEYYICYVNGSTSNVSSKIVNETSAHLKTSTDTWVFKMSHGVPTYVKNIVVEMEPSSNRKTITLSFTYSDVETLFSLPTTGFFQKTIYNSYINGTNVLNGVQEVFFTIA